MPESRDRFVRPVDIATVFAQKRSGTLGILRDEPEQSSDQLESAVTRLANTTAARGQSIGGGLGNPRSAFGHRRRNVYGFTSATRGRMGRENAPTGSTRRGSFALPAWYPRTPLRDITAVVRAIERRRAGLGEVEGLQMESPMPQDQRVVDRLRPLSGAQLEHNTSVLSPNPPSVSKTPKILLDITNQAGGELESVTPQRKLLNSIDKVEKVIKEELNKQKRTPRARKAEREKRVRTLMSMR